MADSSTATSTACTFTDRIPPEIRTKIFRHLLKKDRPAPIFRITTRKTHMLDWAEWTTSTTDTCELVRSRYVFDTTRKCCFTAIFTTCKLFAKEAGDVLYGDQHFRFHDTKSGRIFLSGLENWTSSITQISIKQLDDQKKGFFKALVPLVNLRTLTLPHTTFCTASRSTSSFNVLKRALLPFLGALRTHYTQEGFRRDPVDVLVTGVVGCPDCSCKEFDWFVCGRATPAWIGCLECADVQHKGFEKVKVLLRRALEEAK